MMDPSFLHFGSGALHSTAPLPAGSVRVPGTSLDVGGGRGRVKGQRFWSLSPVFLFGIKLVPILLGEGGVKRGGGGAFAHPPQYTLFDMVALWGRGSKNVLDTGKHGDSGK